jgi:hypothetical protein
VQCITIKQWRMWVKTYPVACCVVLLAFSLRCSDEAGKAAGLIGIESRRIACAVGPTLAISAAQGELHSGLWDREELLALYPAERHATPVAAALCESMVPLPVVPGESAPIELVCMPDGLIPGLKVRYGRDYTQVVLFIPSRAPAQPHISAYIWNPEIRRFEFKRLYHPSEADGTDLRPAEEFFEAARSLWSARKGDDRDGFDLVRKGFTGEDRFVASTGWPETPVILSGQQLVLMWDILSEHWSDNDQGKP